MTFRAGVSVDVLSNVDVIEKLKANMAFRIKLFMDHFDYYRFANETYILESIAHNNFTTPFSFSDQAQQAHNAR